MLLGDEDILRNLFSRKKPAGHTPAGESHAVIGRRHGEDCSAGNHFLLLANDRHPGVCGDLHHFIKVCKNHRIFRHIDAFDLRDQVFKLRPCFFAVVILDLHQLQLLLLCNGAKHLDLL